MIRYPAVAGYFYPSDPEELYRMLEALFRSASPPEVPGRIIGAVVPHAGYIYSGRTAAHFYKLLAKERPREVLIAGPNHTGLGTPLSVFPRGEWVTPLGYVQVNEALAQEVVERSLYASFDVEAHLQEHSVEVQLPFLQYVWGDDFSFVPVVMLIQNYEYAKDLASAVPENVLFLASSDFSHYVPADWGREVDFKLIEAILDLDARRFLRLVEELKASPCGPGPIASLILWAREQGASAKLLHFSNSGEVNGDYSSVVDYAAIAFYV
ncbi:MAG: AmmeMemoRadiSam system protein B [Candidatus Diapherotrites archaeon]|nr:AmmeMemoRadiSam system protein B [Candidatus Diapherotrites archaeon]